MIRPGWSRHANGLLGLGSSSNISRHPCLWQDANHSNVSTYGGRRTGSAACYSSASNPKEDDGPPAWGIAVSHSRAIPRDSANEERAEDWALPDDNAPKEEWPLLRRKKKPTLRYENLQFSYPTSAEAADPPPEKLEHSRSRHRLMLIIEGLSPNLNASDFYRLGPSSLSDWGSAIKKVQQRRITKTLEPMGKYFVTFDSAEAATAYRDKLLKLHRLSGYKLKSASGLWESSVPADLRTKLVRADAGEQGLNQLVEDFTLFPASLRSVRLLRKRVSISHPWARKLEEMTGHLGYGQRPQVVLLEVYPPSLTTKDLQQFIRTDGQARGQKWHVAAPLHLQQAYGHEFQEDEIEELEEEEEEEDDDEEETVEGEEGEEKKYCWKYKDHDTMEQLKRRFVIICNSEPEARRFQRRWNNRSLTAEYPKPERYLVYASMIKW